ncbi:short-chain dehydrogenase, partial [Halobacterium salinarum]|nr:short-chain dehydrogenase [Halobacterium salinarum]
GHPERQQPSARSRDEDTARRLWTVSADRTGVDFDLPDPA